MKTPSPTLIAPLAGAVAALGFAPLSWWPATLIGLAVWLHLLAASATWRRAAWRSWLFGVGHFTVNNNWIQHAFDFQDRMPPVLGYGAVVGLALYLAVYPMLAGIAVHGIRHRAGRVDAGFVLTAGAAWIGAEYLRATAFTGYAWNPLGVIWVPTPLAQSAAWIGTYALSGVTVVLAGAIVLAGNRYLRSAAVLAAAPAALAVAGWAATPPRAVAPADAPRVRIVQPNIGQETQGQPGRDRLVLDTLAALSGSPGPAPRLIVWPEGMVDYYLEDGYAPEWYQGVAPAEVRARIASVLGPRDSAAVGSTALFFDQRGEVREAGNSVFVVRPDATLGGRYDKAHLVPYGEYLPMRTLLEPLGLSRLVAGDIDFADGPGPRNITVPGFGPVGMQVCYEIIFSGQVVDPAQRPALLFNPSNDAWFGRWGPPQHLAQARMRAIEEGLPILRSTPTGISAVIDAHGRLVAAIPHGSRGAEEVALPPARAATPFARIGNWMALLVALLLLAGGVAIGRRAR